MRSDVQNTRASCYEADVTFSDASKRHIESNLHSFKYIQHKEKTLNDFNKNISGIMVIYIW